MLADELLSRLPDGWQLVSAGRAARALVTLTRPIEGDFTAVTELHGMARGYLEDFPVDVLGLDVGVAYEPLRRRWPLLGAGFSGALVSEGADDLVGRPRDWPAILDHEERTPQLMGELAPLVSPALGAFAGAFMTVDALLEDVAADALQTAALLAAIGQFPAAAEALARLDPDTSPIVWRREERALTEQQLQRWIDAQDDLSLTPVPSVEPPVAPSETSVKALGMRAALVTRSILRRPGKP